MHFPNDARNALLIRTGAKPLAAMGFWKKLNLGYLAFFFIASGAE